MEIYEKQQTRAQSEIMMKSLQEMRANMEENRRARNPQYRVVSESIERGMAKAAETNRAKKEAHERELARQQDEARAKKKAEIEESSGWLWDAIRRKRGF